MMERSDKIHQRRRSRVSTSVLTAFAFILVFVLAGLPVIASAQSGATPDDPQSGISVTSPAEEDDVQSVDSGENQSGSEEEAPDAGIVKHPTQRAAQSLLAAPYASEAGCFYANPGSGAYAQSLCWIDLSGFTTEYRDRGANAVPASPRYASILDPINGPFVFTPTNPTTVKIGTTRWGPVQNYPISIDLGGGYRMTAHITTSNTSGSTNALAVTSTSFPTWGSDATATGAFLGRNGFYTGVQGKPALYQAVDAGGGVSTAELKNIKMTGPSGQEVRNYSIVVADAESTDAGERITWSTTGVGFRWLPNDPTLPLTQTKVMGNACSQTATPAWNSTTPSQSAECAANVSPNKTGTAMLHTAPPASASTSFSVTQNMKGGGKEGVAFGVIIARLEATVKVADRIVDSNGQPTQGAFSIAATLAGSSLLSATTGLSGLQSSTSQAIPIDAASSQAVFTTASTAPQLASYQTEWVCTKTVSTSSQPLRWPTTGTSATPPPANDSFTNLKAGEYLGCTVTYTPPYLQLKKSVTNPQGYAPTPLPASSGWTLSAVGGPTGGTAAFSGAGETARTAVPVGTYALSEAVNAALVEGPGFEKAGWACSGTGGTLSGSNVSVALKADIQCTVTNQSKPSSVTWSKTASGTSQRLSGSQWELKGPLSASTTAIIDDCMAAPCPTGTMKDQDPRPGEFTITGLKWGTYQLRETKAPAGYIMSTYVHQFVTGKDGGIFTLDASVGEISNDQQLVPALPVTGGWGRDHVYVLSAGLAVMVAAGVVAAYLRDRASRRRFAAREGSAYDQ